MKFVAYERKLQGTGASRRLRNAQKVPGIVYGAGTPAMIELDPTTKVSKKVPLHFINEENSPAVKTDKCLVNHVVTDVQIQCLASQLPEFLTVDLSNLARGQSLHVSALKLADGIKVVTHGKKDPVIVSVSMLTAEEEVAAAPVVAAAPAAAGKPKKDEKQNRK